MNKQWLHLMAVCVLLTAGITCSRAQERHTGSIGTDITSGAETSGGWVIEIGGGDGQDETTTPSGQVQIQTQSGSSAQPAPVRGPGIEMILGGQGTDGKAKRGTLPVLD